MTIKRGSGVEKKRFDVVDKNASCDKISAEHVPNNVATAQTSQIRRYVQHKYVHIRYDCAYVDLLNEEACT